MRKVEFQHVRNDGEVDCFRVEIYSEEGNMFPVGTAHVVVIHGAAQLNFIIVADQWRRQGFGKELILAVKGRWPQLTATSGMDEMGEGLLNAVGLFPDLDT